MVTCEPFDLAEFARECVYEQLNATEEGEGYTDQEFANLWLTSEAGDMVRRYHLDREAMGPQVMNSHAEADLCSS